MSREEILRQMLTCGVIAVIRMEDVQKLRRVVEAVREGGVTIIEITMTVPGALDILRTLAQEAIEGVLLGVGSVLSADVARKAVEAGARFVVSPVFVPEIIQEAHRLGVPALPGCFSPTEIHRAHEMGADLVKVFPADVLGIPFIKAIRAPMPHLQLVPTGGVTPENAGDWIRAGAAAVGVGSALLDKKAIQEENYAVITARARRLRSAVEEARTPVNAR